MAPQDLWYKRVDGTFSGATVRTSPPPVYLTQGPIQARVGQLEIVVDTLSRDVRATL